MDMEELWSKTREVLRAEVNAVVYNSLLGSNNLVPALLDGDTLVLRVVMDNLKLLITNQWYSTIVRALSQVAVILHPYDHIHLLHVRSHRVH